jgi:enoyl-CoA hydratase/carnithine racemase
MSEPVLLTEDRASVRILTLNRPGKLNALNTELTQAIHDGLLEADRDDRVRAIVIAGAGRAFCAGADLSEFDELTPANGEAVTLRADLTSRTQMLAQQLTKPVVSVVQGAAVGGGAGLAIGADMVIVAPDVKFGYPEVTHSIVPALVMTGLQRHLGRKLAFELVSTGRFLGAHEMLDHGLANEIADDPLERGVAVAATWAEHSPRAMQAIKNLFYRVAELPVDEAMRAGREVNTAMRGFRDEG